MAQAKDGDTVKVHYTGTLDDGSQFDSSAGRDPLEFKLGEGSLIPGFEQAVIGMAAGESKSVKIPSGEAYGDRREELVIVVERTQLPEGLEPKIGENLQLQQGENQFRVRITEVAEDNVTLDANHPLAGQDLTFAIELVAIV